MVQGLAGATHAGVAREAAFANPASATMLSANSSFLQYEIPSIQAYNAGGRAYNVGLYDGGDPAWKGALDYSRVSKARIFAGQQGYVDRSEIRGVLAHQLFGSVQGGVNGRIVKNYNDPGSASFFEGDVGVITPLFADMRGGVTFENVMNREDEYPQTIGAGLSYGIGYGISLIADGSKLLSGSQSGAKGWSLAAEMAASGDFVIRGGAFQEAYRGLRGWALGLSWIGPRFSIDYAFKTVGGGPKEKAHILGLVMAM